MNTIAILTIILIFNIIRYFEITNLSHIFNFKQYLRYENYRIIILNFTILIICFLFKLKQIN